jgi:hypothetical protein
MSISYLTEELFICNSAIPALEELSDWEFNSEKKRDLIDWYKNLIKKSQIYNSFTYLDLTFELPNNGAFTIAYTNENSSSYLELLKEFIGNGNTIYVHPSFKNGQLSNKLNKLEFFSHLYENANSDNLQKSNTENEISCESLVIESLYSLWDKEKLEKFLKSDINTHLSSWANIHDKYKNKLKSISNYDLGIIYVIPIGVLDRQDNFKLIGGLYLGLDNKFCEKDAKYFIRSLLLPIITNYQRYQSKRVFHEAIKSAKAAIISRNQSHNIGSHVLYYLRQKFNGEVEQLKELLNEIEVKFDNTSSPKIDINHSILADKLEIPYLRGVGSFLTYIQERQDFIAAIATDQVPSYTTVNFKAFVIDNFTKDLKAQRHNVAKKEVNILLSYLTKSEDIEVEIKYNGRDLAVEKPLKDYGQDKESKNQDINIYTEDIDLPGGVLGRQAIYCILENIIRNAAKHGKIPSNTLIIDISIDRPTKDANNIRWLDEYYKISITDNSNTDELKVNEIRDWLQEELIDENMVLIENHKGIKEIVICALWLCGKSVSEVSEENRLRYINVNRNKLGNLIYEFYVYQPKKLLLIGNNKYNLSEYGETPKIETSGESFNSIKRYDILVSKSDSDYKNAFRRYVKVDKFVQDNNCVDLSGIDAYIEYYKLYLTDKFGVDYNNFPKFLINIKSGSSSAKKTLKILDLKFVSLFDKMDYHNGEIKIDNKLDILYNQSGVEGTKCIAFRRHLNDNIHEFFNYKLNIESKESIINCLKEAKKKYVSVESVTGDNGSFGMIVNSDIDDVWVLNQFEAAFAKVLIIDERLYETYKFHKQEIDNGLVNELKESLKINTNDQLLNQINTKINDMEEPELQEFISRIFKTKETWNWQETKDKIREHIEKKPIVNYKDPILFSLKNIDIASPTNGFEYYDLFNDKIEIASQGYHFISIHQGVIDKYANYIGTPNDKGNALLKIKENFEKSNKLIKLIVHTGRGKPNYTKGRLPYRSLSDLDYAIKESKTALIDYFNSATYE